MAFISTYLLSEIESVLHSEKITGIKNETNFQDQFLNREFKNFVNSFYFMINEECVFAKISWNNF